MRPALRYVHRLVLAAFRARPGGVGELSLLQANHENGRKGDNLLGNLKWTTPGGNVQHAWDTGLIPRTRAGRRRTHCRWGHPLDQVVTQLDRLGHMRSWKRCGRCRRVTARRTRDRALGLRSLFDDVRDPGPPRARPNPDLSPPIASSPSFVAASALVAGLAFARTDTLFEPMEKPPVLENPSASDRRIDDRRVEDVGPPAGVSERRRTKSGRRATDAMKMGCPFCADSESAVVRSRGAITEDKVRRRRECAGCGRRFPTMELVDWDALLREFQNDQDFQEGIAMLQREFPDDEQLRARPSADSSPPPRGAAWSSGRRATTTRSSSSSRTTRSRSSCASSSRRGPTSRRCCIGSGDWRRWATTANASGWRSTTCCLRTLRQARGSV